jgi:hypothetical protein
MLLSIFESYLKNKKLMLITFILIPIIFFDLGLNKKRWVNENALKSIENSDFPYTMRSEVFDWINKTPNVPVLHLPYEFMGPHAGKSFALYSNKWYKNPLINRGGLLSNNELFYENYENLYSQGPCVMLNSLKLDYNNILILVEKNDPRFGMWDNLNYSGTIDCLFKNYRLIKEDDVRLLFQ